MIIQGSNQPIVITFDDDIKENTKDLKVLLYTTSGELKSWTMDDLVIAGCSATAALTQEETLSFPVGNCYIEIKWLDSAGITQFNKIVQDRIVFRSDKRLLEVE